MQSIGDDGSRARSWKKAPTAAGGTAHGVPGREAVAAALRRALEEAVEEAAGQEIVGALAAVAGGTAVAEAREWLLARVPASPRAGEIVTALGELPDPIARAEATRIAAENFVEKRLSGRWDVVLASQSTAAARATLLQAVAGEDEAAVWAAAQAMLGAWEEVPRSAFEPLRTLLRSEAAPEAVRFCAAVLLARGDDAESWSEVRPWLMAALEAEEEADQMPEPTRAAAALLARGEGEERVQARAFLLARLGGATEAVLERALPPLLAEPDPGLIGALVAACRRRRVGSPSAERLAAAFAAFRGGALAGEAYRALVAALGPRGAGAPREATLISALGHLGRPEALAWLEARAATTEDPALQAAIAAAQARLGDPAAIDRCAALFLGEAADAVAPFAADDARLAALARVLADVPALAIPTAVGSLLRALETPRLAPHAARALAALYPLAPGAGEESAAPDVKCAPPEPVPVAISSACTERSEPDRDRTLDLSANLLPAIAEVQPYGVASPTGERGSPEGGTPIPVTRWTAEGDPSAVEAAVAADLDWVRRGYGRRPERPRERRRFRFFRPMGLQRFGGVAGALATCAILGMGYMRWLPAQPEAPEPPKTPPVLATVVVITPGTTVHARRGEEYPVVKTTRRGDTLQVVGKTAGWWKVRFPNGVTGWIERRDTAVVVPQPGDDAKTATTEAARPAPAVHLVHAP